MKKCFTFIFLILMLCPSMVFGQNYDNIREYVINTPEKYDNNPRSLAKYLTMHAKEDWQKAMMVFAWISLNIEYDSYKANKMTGNDKIPKIGNIWKTRVGVCLDIAELYEELLGYANVRSEVVLGYAGDGMTRRTYKDHGHAWNVVYADGKKILVDPTWGIEGTVGGGYLNDLDYKMQSSRRKKDNDIKAKKMTRRIDYAWFNIKPEVMIRTHYPRDDKWQLMASPYSLNKFLSQNVATKF